MYANILVPIDGSDVSTRGLDEAIKLGKRLGSRLRLLHIANARIVDCGYGPGTYGADLIELTRAEGQKILSDATASARRSGVEVETMLLESTGSPAAALIVTHARDWPADLIVMGTHGRQGLRRLAMGSDAESVVRDTHLPVLLVHGPVAAPASDPGAGARYNESAPHS